MENLTFTDSHNMVAFLEKLEDNVDFVEIVDFLNASPISSKSTAWNEFGTNIASAVICLAKKQKFSFSKLIFDDMLRNLDPNSKKFLMYPRFLQLFLNNQIENLTAVFNDEYDTPSHTKKVFANMRRQGKDFSGTVTPLFATMLIQSQAVEGEGSGQPTEPQHTPTTASPSHVEPIPIVASSSQPKKTQKHRKTKRKATEISQSSGPTTLVADETVHEERGDSVERAATTATSLDAEQGSGNINRTQSTAIPNDPFPQGIGSGGSPRRQDTMGDRPAQTRFERLSKQSNEPPLSRVNTLGSGEDSMKLQELMDLCTKLSDKVLDLENVKNAQALEIQKLKKRVKKLESKKKSRTPQLKRRLFKVRIESSAEKSLGDHEDSSKQGRNEIDQDEGILCINITTVEPVTTASTLITTAGVSVSTAEPKREEEASKAANIAEWDDVQAMMDADYELAVKLQAEEQGKISIEERVVPELAAGSLKRAAEEELDQESSKRQKTGESSELAEETRDKEADELSQEELQQMMIIVPEQGMNVEALQTKDDLVMMWSLVKEKFNSTEPTDDKRKRDMVHHVSIEKGIDIYLLVEKEYPLSKGTLTLMLVAKLLVDQDNEMSRELLRKIFMGGLLGIKGFLTFTTAGSSYNCWLELLLLLKIEEKVLKFNMSRTNSQAQIVSKEQLVTRANRLVIKKNNQRAALDSHITDTMLRFVVEIIRHHKLYNLVPLTATMPPPDPNNTYIKLPSEIQTLEFIKILSYDKDPKTSCFAILKVATETVIQPWRAINE
ncbi:hypothetical protein Tco_0619205 [Tanacetum coccineum]